MAMVLLRRRSRSMCWWTRWSGMTTGSWVLTFNVGNLADKAHLANCDGAGRSCCSYGELLKLPLTATLGW